MEVKLVLKPVRFNHTVQNEMSSIMSSIKNKLNKGYIGREENSETGEISFITTASNNLNEVKQYLSEVARRYKHPFLINIKSSKNI